MSLRTYSADVVVVGAGMAGLVAAVTALEHDAEVVVLEKGTRAGGSMLLSAGNVFTYDSYDEARAAIPHGDPGLQRRVVDGHDDGIEWLSDLGANLREPDEALPFGSGKTVDPGPFTDLLVDIVEERGGDILLETPVRALETPDGEIVGVRAGSDEEIRILADSVVLATGGFQGNEALLEQYVTDTPENVWLRSNPWSTGDGLIAARDAGAKLTRGMGTFFGKTFPAPPAEIKPEDFFDAKQHYGPTALALGADGRRFTDESSGTLVQDMASTPTGVGYYVLDSTLYDSKFDGMHVGTAVETAERLGGRVARVETLDELESALFEWGVHGWNAIRTVETYNEAIENDRGRTLDPPRAGNRRAMTDPPYYAVEVQPAIVETMGGLAVTMDMEVVRRAASGTSLRYYPEHPSEAREESIPGLYAAGADVGNVMHTHFMGGLSVALTTGRIAGRNAATTI